MGTIQTIILSLSGILLFLVGTMRLTNPIKTYLKNSGIKLENDISLLNEIRGVSAVQLLAGVIILLGIFFPKLTTSSFLIASLIFIGFAMGRMFSLKVDGKPNKLIIQGLVFELVLGMANIFCLSNLLF